MRDLFDEMAGNAAREPQKVAQDSATPPLRKRFYKDVSVAPRDGGFAITLDGRAIRTPSRAPVVAPTPDLAEQIAAEWRAQGETLDPLTMPLTRLANSVVDGVIGREGSVRDDLSRYFESDLVCYRAAHPAELVAREAAAWDGVLVWAADALGARFILAEGIVHATQPPQAVSAAISALPHDAWPLAACHIVTTITGSALLALALWHGVRTADAAFAAGCVDEDWNADRWGYDAEVMARRAARRRDFDAAAMVIAALRPPTP